MADIFKAKGNKITKIKDCAFEKYTSICLQHFHTFDICLKIFLLFRRFIRWTKCERENI